MNSETVGQVHIFGFKKKNIEDCRVLLKHTNMVSSNLDHIQITSGGMAQFFD